jgi:hypothetical protein
VTDTSQTPDSANALKNIAKTIEEIAMISSPAAMADRPRTAINKRYCEKWRPQRAY